MERDRFPQGVDPFDGLLVGWASYMLMPGRARRIAFLAGAREVMRPGAPALLSFYARSADDRTYARVARVANAVRRLRRREPVEEGDALRPNYVHSFTRAEIAAEAEAAGFALESYEDRPYGHAILRAA
jgi:hypothetical protein